MLDELWVEEGEPGKLILVKVHHEELVRGCQLRALAGKLSVKVRDVFSMPNFWLKRWLHLPGFHLFPVNPPEECVTLDLLSSLLEAAEPLGGVFHQEPLADVFRLFANGLWIRDRMVCDGSKQLLFILTVKGGLANKHLIE